ncbi:hypothetical protein [Planktothrix agardhii]|uniref:Uncharacterized protein n=1 Tax=Planktothrix agardhii (strain NIVA-CYA 126/8) TaxID=388467 RepID=A0A073CCA7_PLAA1|nr:hypothetical protein [Planktothrix agardhii]KEI65562.1 hypothetical protein A19Y_0340 [Planktothrix agardhii NIVA-CYA 126/8]CAD5914954.1 hypothetical protein NIVACYA_00722 [Planktothrix agardhii]
MQLHQIVRINESGIVANAVNFGMMADADKNLKLCQGFIFNYNQGYPKSSTLGVLDAIQKSYQSVNQANIHLFVQDYGKGKSHFALVAANYFKQLLDSPEVEGILDQIKIASEHNQGIVEDLKTYKKRNPKHLVICISGDDGLDLKQIFLRSLGQTLETEGITDSLAQQMCQKPLEYLTQLTESQKEIANQYLENNDYQGDLDSIIELLNQDNYRVVSTVKSISGELNNGFTIDFKTDLSVEKILEELINELCSGANAKYSGILILFDELNYYLKSWATDSVKAGGACLQSITNICENYKSKIALVCFTQIRPLKSVPNQSAEDYKKLASRLEIAESTYEPVSSLELVIKGLLDQQVNPNLWNQFCQKWDNTLFADSRKAHQTRINIDRERDWKLEDFQTNLTRRGCFPLHPLNSYLLCNLDFTQGRTVIQYIKENVKQFINSQPVEKNGKLNYIPAISLVDAFEQLEFSRHYSEYQKAFDTIASSATEAEKAVLKGLLLFYVSQNKLNKSESEKHDVILSELTGLSEKETKETLDILSQKKQVIYFNKGDNTYRFYSGSNLTEIKQEIEEEVSKKLNEISVNLAVNHCQEKIETYFPSQKIEGTDFINKNKLLNDEWFFEYKFYNIPDLKRVLNSHQAVEKLEGKGIFAYVLAETIEELQELHHQINDLLSQAKNKKQIAVAIPNNKPIIDICKDLLAIDIITRKGRSEKEELGTAYEQYKKQLQDEIKREVKEIIGSSTYYCLELDQLTTFQKQNPESIVSHLLKQLYPFVPPLNQCSTMSATSTTKTKVIKYLAKSLLEDNNFNTKSLDNSYKNLIDAVCVQSWALFKITSQEYSVQIPTNKNVREAWDKISQLTELEDKPKKYVPISKIWLELSAPPFGYNEYTFTMLFSGWIAYHRSEVMLQGNFGIPKNSKEQVSPQEKSIKNWATTNVFDNPKYFVDKWILAPGKTPQLIRSQTVACPEIPVTIDYHKADKLIKEIDQFINSADPDQAKVQEITPKRKQLLAEIKKINDWFKPVEEAENLLDDVNLETLLKLYPSLQQQPQNINLASPLKSDSIVVNRTSQQNQRQVDALEKVKDKIEEMVIQLSEKSESLKTQQEYGRYQGELETAIEKITQVSLPEHLIKTLNYSLNVATRKLDEIQHQTEIKDCLEKINLRYNSLSTNASQEDYIKALSEIENLTNNLEIVKQESQYQTIIQDIESKQTNLETTLKIWSERLTGITKNEALKLSQEVSQQKNRFTQIESAQRVNQILDKLEPIILEIENQEELEVIKTQSIDRQNESQEEQIIALFIQLPPERKQILYAKLGEYLSKEEEINE